MEERPVDPSFVTVFAVRVDVRNDLKWNFTRRTLRSLPRFSTSRFAGQDTF